MKETDETWRGGGGVHGGHGPWFSLCQASCHLAPSNIWSLFSIVDARAPAGTPLPKISLLFQTERDTFCDAVQRFRSTVSCKRLIKTFLRVCVFASPPPSSSP